jgi:anti-anti-sigma factor
VPIHTEEALSVLHPPAHTVVALHGELDIATAPAWRERLLGLLRPGTRLLILDLSGLSFCEAAGLAVLIGTRRRAMPLGIALVLAAPRPQVAKVLRATGLDRSLTIRPTLADALARPTAAEPAAHAGPVLSGLGSFSGALDATPPMAGAGRKADQREHA